MWNQRYFSNIISKTICRIIECFNFVIIYRFKFYNTGYVKYLININDNECLSLIYYGSFFIFE